MFALVSPSSHLPRNSQKNDEKNYLKYILNRVIIEKNRLIRKTQARNCYFCCIGDTQYIGMCPSSTSKEETFINWMHCTLQTKHLRALSIQPDGWTQKNFNVIETLALLVRISNLAAVPASDSGQPLFRSTLNGEAVDV